MLTGDELKRKRLALYEQMKGHDREPGELSDAYQPDIPFTCDNCVANETCHWAFDAYNIDGDCLASK